MNEMMKEMRLLQLQYSVQHKDMKDIEELLAEGTPINGRATSNGLTCLDVAKQTDMSLVLDLIEKGASHVHLPTEIVTAVKEEKIDKVDEMLGVNKELPHGRDEYGNTLLHIANKENKPMIEMLEGHGVQKHAKNQYGKTYLQVAESDQETSNLESSISTPAPRR